LLVVQDAIDFMDREYPAGQLKAAFSYRYDGLMEIIDGQTVFSGENKKSSAFMEGKLGFVKMATKYNEDDYVAREMADGCHIYHPRWTYLWCNHAKMRSRIKYVLNKRRERANPSSGGQ